MIDISMAAQNIMLLATAKGLASCPVRSFNQAAVKKLLKIPVNIEVELIISLGYPLNNCIPPKRKGVEEVTCFNQWPRGKDD